MAMLIGLIKFRDIREGMVGTRGFTANFALIITWERMGYGGQPKFLRLDEYERIKRYVNPNLHKCKILVT